MDFKLNGKGNKVWDPTGLKRILDQHYPGATTVVEAVQKARSLKPAPLPTLDTPDPNKAIAEAFTAATKAIQEATQSKTVSDFVEERLARMPTNTIEQINAWRDAWLQELDKVPF